jgi:hypothetical protein
MHRNGEHTYQKASKDLINTKSYACAHLQMRQTFENIYMHQFLTSFEYLDFENW